MMIWAWIGALLIGLSLGLLGSGGSILTVPVLAYLVGEPDKLAIAESLGIVTAISLIGAIPFALRRQVDWRNVVYFGVPGMAGTYLGAFLSQYLPGAAQLALFALVMLLAAVMMFRRPKQADEAAPAPHAAWKIVVEGIAVGILTGLVGVGGGFLIVPALVILGGLSMQLAVGTSLLIIALKSISGFIKYIDVLRDAGQAINWDVVVIFAAIGIVGSLLGNRIGRRLSQDMLRRGFAVFLVVMGTFILLQNVGKLLPESQAAPARTVEPSTVKRMSFFSSFLGNRTTSERGGAQRLSAREFVAHPAPDAVVIDVRTAGEYRQGHVAGANHIDVSSPDFAGRIDALDRDRTYYLYCRSGNRSGMAAGIMASKGFSRVYNIGGIGELTAAGAKIE